MNLNLKHIFLGIAATAALTVGAAPLAMRSTAVSELAPYCFPANRPANTSVTFMPDGTSYVMRSDDGKRLITYDAATGKEGETIFDLGRTRENTMEAFEGFTISPDGTKILVWQNSEPVYRRSSTAEYFVYEIRTRLLRPLSKEHKRQSVPLFSPDSRMVAFVADNNIYAAKLDYESEVPVTTDGAKGKIINGATDWTYEEEFGITSLMSWAPDCLTLCYVKFDESDVPLYTLPIYEGTCNPRTEYALYPGAMSYKYPVAGKPNSRVSVHSYDVETRKTKELTFAGSTPYYIPRIAYGPDETKLMISTLNRDQNQYELFCTNPKSTVSKSVYSYRSKAWVEESVYSGIYYGPNSFFIGTDEGGYTTFHEVSYAGSEIRKVGVDKADATAFYGCDEAGNAYFQAASPRPIDRTVYSLDKKGVVKVIGHDRGSSSAVMAPGCKFMQYTHSDIATPPVTDLRRPGGKALRTICDNAQYAANAKSLKADKEFMTVNVNGNELNAYMVRPRNFDASKRYPVVMSQYSGPGSQQVLDRWTLDWEDYYASRGYIVFCVDGRGTGGRGEAFRTAVYRRLGQLETDDQTAAARYLATLPYVDSSRIGIYGWSYGGYEALMCATADDCPFAAAVAVAPVTDWRYYDTVYTERFMLTPQQNETGYNEASVLRRALRLGCPLLVMYGTSDDNVHPANSLQLVSTLQSAGILCDMFVFPNMNHSINGCNARQVVYGRMFDFFNDKLKE